MVLSVASRGASYLKKKKKNKPGDEVFLTLNAAIRAPSSVKRRYQRRQTSISKDRECDRSSVGSAAMRCGLSLRADALLLLPLPGSV